MDAISVDDRIQLAPDDGFGMTLYAKKALLAGAFADNDPWDRTPQPNGDMWLTYDAIGIQNTEDADGTEAILRYRGQVVARRWLCEGLALHSNFKSFNLRAIGRISIRIEDVQP